MDTAVSKKTMTLGRATPFRSWGWRAALFALTFVVTAQAHAFFIDNPASSFNLTCNSGGMLPPAGILAACDVDQTAVFTRVVCEFEAIVAQAMGAAECKISSATNTPVIAALTLYIVLLGIGFITGMISMSKKEVMTGVFKSAVIIAIVSSSTFGYTYGFRLFEGLAKQGTGIMLSVLNTAGDPNCPTTGSSQTEALTKSLDLKLASFAQDEGDDQYTGGDPCLSTAMKHLNPKCLKTVQIIIDFIILTMPFLGIIFSYSVVKFVAMFGRAVLGYLSGLFFLMFLMILAPIFLSFSLFKRTRDLFTRWLGYLISFSLQIVIVFAFFAFAKLFDVTPFLSASAELVQPINASMGIGHNNVAALTPVDCSLCQMDTDGKGNLLFKAFVPDPNKPNLSIQAPYCDTTGLTIPFTDMNRQSQFFAWVLIQFIGLIVLVSVLEDFIEKAPQLARNLGSVRYAAVLGGDAPGDGANLTFKGYQSINSGIENARAAGLRHSVVGLTPVNLVRGIGAGIDGFMTGVKTEQYQATLASYEQQKQEIIAQQTKARGKTDVYFDALKKKIKEKDIHALSYANDQYDQAKKNEEEQTKNLQRVQRRIDNLKDNPEVSNKGIKQEIDDMDDINELTQQGQRAEAKDRSEQEWYNMLSGYSEADNSTSVDADLNELKISAGRISDSIRSSVDYKNLSPSDAQDIDAELEELDKASSYSDVDGIRDAITSATQKARILAIRW